MKGVHSVRVIMLFFFVLGMPTAWCESQKPTIIQAVGIENEYADVIAQIGGQYVNVTAIITDPNTDPHMFELSPKIAAQIAAADLVIENGLGYDGWADKMLSVAPKVDRKVINVQRLLGLNDSTPNPHLWYDPKTMPAVVALLTDDLIALQPDHAAYFRANQAKFEASLTPWLAALAALKKDFPGSPVAVTEPVGDYMLDAAGLNIATPYSLELAIMNGTDPAPQDVTFENKLFSAHKVKALIYNQQVTDPLTEAFLNAAKKNHIAVVGVYETMPVPGYNYQSWMLAETNALRDAISENLSTQSLARGVH
ncbi:MAG: cation ABC transporter substrate-binding protein [Acidocella sp. 20-57-95]|nr:MAG: cation ABC transporter substrate-binding protein [Acidocella sp. 20-57-95]HQT64405.1 zinc ABC transporter substrate-binding protein [Acidocella sp.]